MSEKRRQVLGGPAKGYSRGLLAEGGRFAFISGQVALDREGNVVSPGSLKEQAEYAFASIASLLAEAGATLDDVVKITTFITDMSRYSEFAQVRSDVFKGHYPASSTVEVSALVIPELLVEIEAVAII